MLLEDRSYTHCVIGAKTIRGTGGVQLRIAGEYLGTCMIIGISMMPDVHGKALQVGNV